MERVGAPSTLLVDEDQIKEENPTTTVIEKNKPQPLMDESGDEVVFVGYHSSSVSNIESPKSYDSEADFFECNSDDEERSQVEEWVTQAKSELEIEIPAAVEKVQGGLEQIKHDLESKEDFYMVEEVVEDEEVVLDFHPSTVTENEECTKKVSSSLAAADNNAMLTVHGPDGADLVVSEMDWSRFLVARQGNVAAAAEMLARNLEWRAQNLPVAREGCLRELRAGKFFVRGHDRMGRPIVAFLADRHAPGDRDVDEAVRMMVYVVEQALAAGASNHQQKFNFFLYAPKGSRMDVELIKKTAKVFQDNYPERMHRLYIFPCGSLVQMFFGMVKYFLDPGLRAKIVMLKTRRPPELQDDIAVDQLLIQWGGTDPWTFDPDAV
eukprot:CAMPEP_0194570116 /NCGR_PEP_ID=MMETSP0292-20121207/7559_1 /TAXON_ID=39354 /ORGANISM="Heterosigma akashiwo, Strain CCMP2393" /LENGTH=379 /DNA_ID=CAMNT_0039420499 /DNA_START=128 /DNA_END=1267 /DNA_ORIENTATION=-